MYINNFRALMTYSSPPPLLVEVGREGDMIIYHSQFNELAYIVFNPENEVYYAFENNGKSKEPINDLITMLRVTKKI